jgi:hypothetical protein
MNLAKMIAHETKEKKSRIPRITFPAGPVSAKAERIEDCPGRFSEVTG